MLDLNNPEQLERYMRAGDEFKKYNLLRRKSDYKRYASFNAQKKIMYIVPERRPEKAESFPMGQLLLDFANLDLSEYEKEWRETARVLADPDTEYVEYGSYVGLNRIEKLSPEDLQYEQCVYLDRLVKRFQHIHPYLLVLDSDYMTLANHNPMRLLETELNFVELQKQVRKYIDLCLNEQVDAVYSQLLPTQRYLLHHRTTEQMPYFTNKSTLYVRIPNQHDEPENAFTFAQIDHIRKLYPGVLDETNLFPGIDAVSINAVLSGNLIVEDGYAVQTVRDMAMLELSKMIVSDIRVRRCAFCNQLFIPVGKHDTRYCNRIPEGYTQTCQALGSSRNYAEKMQKENADALYRKMYKRLHQRKQKGAMTEKSFKKWQGDAQYQLERCKNGEITLEEFEELIKK